MSYGSRGVSRVEYVSPCGALSCSLCSALTLNLGCTGLNQCLIIYALYGIIYAQRRDIMAPWVVLVICATAITITKMVIDSKKDDKKSNENEQKGKEE